MIVGGGVTVGDVITVLHAAGKETCEFPHPCKNNNQHSQLPAAATVSAFWASLSVAATADCRAATASWPTTSYPRASRPPTLA